MSPEPSVRRRLTMLALAAVAVMAFGGCGYGSYGTSGQPACADAVLDDWTNGNLGSAYAPDCYEAAIDALPEDLRAYTTAADDIARAAISASREDAEVAARTTKSSRRLADVPAANDPRAFPTEVALLLGILVVLGASGLVAELIRRRRRP
jgi:hypothetical protein